MIEVSINISKQSVFSDVGRLTHYTGEKRDGDANAFVRISTTSGDEGMLGQFWQEACDGVTEQLKPFLQSIDTTEGYYVELLLSGSYDTGLTGSVIENIRSCLTLYIVSRWYMLSNKEDADRYGLDASNQLTEAMCKIYYKKKPSRRAVGERPSGDVERYYAVSVVCSGDGLGIVNGDGTYKEGSQVTLSARAAAGSEFLGWYDGNGVLVSKSASYSTVASKNTSLTARFEKSAVRYSVSLVAGAGIGSVSGADVYPAGSRVRITAVPSGGYVFKHWEDENGDVWFTESSVLLELECDVFLRAVGEVPSVEQYSVELERGDLDDDTGSGSVTGGGVYDKGSAAVLTATPNAGSRFLYWLSDGGVRYYDNPLRITVEKSERLWYYFRKESSGGGGGSVSEYVLSYGISPSGGGVILDNEDTIRYNGDRDVVLDDAACALKAYANNGYRFVKWVVSDASGTREVTSSTFTCIVDGNTSVMAYFALEGTASSVVSYNIDGGGGMSANGVNVGSGSSMGYAVGTEVVLSAVAQSGYRFVRWVVDGVTVGTSSSYKLTVSQLSHSVTACFEEVPSVEQYSVELEQGDLDDDTGSGSVTGGGVYDKGSAAVLTATPNAGSRFLYWLSDGGVRYYDNPLRITVEKSERLWYYFRKESSGSGGDGSGYKVYVTSNVVEESGGWATITVGTRDYSISSGYKTAAIDYAEGMIMSITSSSTKTFSKWQYSTDGVTYIDVPSTGGTITVSGQTSDCYYKAIFN